MGCYYRMGVGKNFIIHKTITATHLVVPTNRPTTKMVAYAYDRDINGNTYEKFAPQIQYNVMTHIDIYYSEIFHKHLNG